MRREEKKNMWYFSLVSACLCNAVIGFVLTMYSTPYPFLYHSLSLFTYFFYRQHRKTDPYTHCQCFIVFKTTEVNVTKFVRITAINVVEYVLLLLLCYFSSSFLLFFITIISIHICSHNDNIIVLLYNDNCTKEK